MCNRYASNGSVDDYRKLAKVLGTILITQESTDNLPSFENVYPDQDAPVITNGSEGELTLTLKRWGFPPVPNQSTPITNIRNLRSNWWRNVNREYLLEPEFRCLVPFSAFAEPVRDPTWFSVPEKDVAYFAGIWRPWMGKRLLAVDGKKRRVRTEGDWELFTFLTTEANDVVRPVHEKAMPVILHDTEECREWLGGGVDSLRLQRPLPNEECGINAKR